MSARVLQCRSSIGILHAATGRAYLYYCESTCKAYGTRPPQLYEVKLAYFYKYPLHTSANVSTSHSHIYLRNIIQQAPLLSTTMRLATTLISVVACFASLPSSLATPAPGPAFVPDNIEARESNCEYCGGSGGQDAIV
jgi:hypothetical protein